MYSSARSPDPLEDHEIASFFKYEIISVHAGAENRTAIHLQLFQALCQPDFFGFHRFFLVFIGFVRY